MEKHDLLFKEQCYEIIGSCMEVHKELGSGFLEAVYEEALSIELCAKKILFESQKVLDVNYKGTILKKKYKADFVCYNEIIVEIKACETLNSQHQSQVLNYLKATGKHLGLLINFGAGSLQFKRIIK